jgi:hypothetical protein
VKESAYLAPRRFELFSFEIEIYVRNHSTTEKESAHHCEDILKAFPL